MKFKRNRTIILPALLYGCETWSLTLREGLRLRVFENRMLRRIFGPKLDGEAGKWRKLHNEELNLLKPNDAYIGRNAPLTSRSCILYIYPTYIPTEYFKHAAYSPFFFLFKMPFIL